MTQKLIKKHINNLNFVSAYKGLTELKHSFRYEDLVRNFPDVNSVKMYLFLMYALSQHVDAEKHISICYYLYFGEPYICGADSMIKWHLLEALKLAPMNIEIINNWVFGIYSGNPDCPFSAEEIEDFQKAITSRGQGDSLHDKTGDGSLS